MTYKLVHPKTGENYRLRIEQDTDVHNPREDCDHASIMVCFHKKYGLPNEGSFGGYHSGNFNSWDGLEAQLVRDGAKVILPVFMYDHSGLSVSWESFALCNGVEISSTDLKENKPPLV